MGRRILEIQNLEGEQLRAYPGLRGRVHTDEDDVALCHVLLHFGAEEQIPSTAFLYLQNTGKKMIESDGSTHSRNARVRKTKTHEPLRQGPARRWGDCRCSMRQYGVD